MSDIAEAVTGALAVSARSPATATRSSAIVPAVVASLGEAAAWRYVEFVTANIRNPNTRRAYARPARLSSSGPEVTERPRWYA
jgi:hypothetical protein